MWTQTFFYFYLGNNEQIVPMELHASTSLSNKQNLSTKHLGVFLCTCLSQLKWKPKDLWVKKLEVIQLNNSSVFNNLFLSCAGSNSSLFPLRGTLLLTAKVVFAIFGVYLSIYYRASHYKEHTMAQKEWNGQQVCKEYKIFLRHFYECDEIITAKIRVCSAESSPYRKVSLGIHNFFITAL